MADVKMPKLGATMEAAVVTKWLKSPGESVDEGEALVEIETEKIENVVAAPSSGTLAEILVGEDEEVPVGTVLGRIEEG
jgi:pyruvate/2-oxoglutarate dehydrogenase complex dihydrolipoamide acyltransferase (E2) component